MSGPARRPLAERFWPKVRLGADDECWLWQASCFTNGYGHIGEGGGRGRTLLAHRVAYELLVGPIPEGTQLDHLCREKKCVNPRHLEPVSGSVNLKRGIGVGGKRSYQPGRPRAKQK